MGKDAGASLFPNSLRTVFLRVSLRFHSSSPPFAGKGVITSLACGKAVIYPGPFMGPAIPQTQQPVGSNHLSTPGSANLH